ncbi:hypothetical protein BGZ80_000948 [Entomortierella chlamydospora]|uniref:Crinkler effector protein N-terminal domain-containing protein n=1 Tax=Entomortierella chlamydospora TaxID=101097 RepID=A0A9P6MSC6_9FUNG|nr:hypothetical protein BGZ79_002333 [Entomortierella chlamydospora]KAG0011095.1 hypothetical protein BGZ80_000948 [Entomortierella chlamydospora]
MGKTSVRKEEDLTAAIKEQKKPLLDNVHLDDIKLWKVSRITDNDEVININILKKELLNPKKHLSFSPSENPTLGAPGTTIQIVVESPVSPRLKIFAHFKFDDYFAKRYGISRREDILPFETLGRVSIESDERYVRESGHIANWMDMMHEVMGSKNKIGKASYLSYYATSTIRFFRQFVRLVRMAYNW